MDTLISGVGLTGASRQSWYAANPRNILKRLVEKYPDATEDEMRELCFGRVRKNADHIETIFSYWFANNYRSLFLAMDQRPKRQKEQKIKADEYKKKIEEKINEKAHIVLLGMLMPTGKTLCDSTKEDLITLGGWAQQIADRLKPGQTVGEAAISEDDLRAIYNTPGAKP